MRETVDRALKLLVAARDFARAATSSFSARSTVSRTTAPIVPRRSHRSKSKSKIKIKIKIHDRRASPPPRPRARRYRSTRSRPRDRCVRPHRRPRSSRRDVSRPSPRVVVVDRPTDRPTDRRTRSCTIRRPFLSLTDHTETRLCPVYDSIETIGRRRHTGTRTHYNTPSHYETHTHDATHKTHPPILASFDRVMRACVHSFASFVRSFDRSIA